MFDRSYMNMFEFGYKITGSLDAFIAIITPKEAFALDSKFDDGKPGTGDIVARVLATSSGVYTNNCTVRSDGVTAATNTDTTTALYNTSMAGDQCVIIFPYGF